MTSLTFDRLRDAIAQDAAIRRIQRLQPAGGPGDKIFPPTYPGERTNDPARHLFETRRIDGVDVRCVLIDSVQSQANRLEDALLAGIRAGHSSARRSSSSGGSFRPPRRSD
jgi:CRISPR-associated protein Csb1